MSTTPSKNSDRKNHSESMFSILGAFLGLFLASPAAVSADQLFALSTETRLELYQAENLRSPNSFTKPANPISHSGTVRGIIGEQVLMDTGLQTTPIGRLTMINRNWQQIAEDTSSKNKLLAALTKDKSRQ